MANLTVEDDFERVYETPSGVKELASAPRFGYSRNVDSLYNGDTEEMNEYMIGLGILAGIVGACFLMFLMTIIIFKCCGKKRVGFLSGSRFEVYLGFDGDENDETRRSTANKKNNENEFVDEPEQYPKHDNPRTSKQKKRSSSSTGCYCCGTIVSVRFTFIMSGCIFIAFAMLMVTQGLTNLQGTVKSVHHSAVNIEYVASEAQDILQNGITQIQTVATHVRAALQEELDRPDFCPDDPELKDNPQAADVTQEMNDAMAHLSQIDTFVDDRINDVAEALSEASGQSQTVVDEVGDVDLTDWHALLGLIVFTLVPSLLVSAAILAHFDCESLCFYNFVDCFMLPLFIFMVVLCVVVSCAMLAAAAVNSDFCLPGGRPDDPYPGESPDASILRFLDAQGFDGEDDYVRKVADWYIHQCRREDVDDPFGFMIAHLPDLHDAEDALDSLNNKINTEGLILELSLYCGRDFDKLGVLLAEMQTLLRVLLESLYRTLNLISCKRVVRLYHTTVYDAACQYSVNGVMWVFASAAVMATFGLIMILFRSAYKPTRYFVAGQELDVIDEYDSDSDSEPESESDEGTRLAVGRKNLENDDKNDDDDDESSSEPESWSDEGTQLKDATAVSRDKNDDDDSGSDPSGDNDDDESDSEPESWSDEGTQLKDATAVSRDKNDDDDSGSDPSGDNDDDESDSEPESWSDEGTQLKDATAVSRDKNDDDDSGSDPSGDNDDDESDSEPESWSDEGTRPKTTRTASREEEGGDVYGSDSESESWSDEGTRPKTAVEQKEDDESSEIFWSDSESDESRRLT